ncbi:hypothetical protein [Chromobacterium haemolyticum]|uniref:hypothetical protein n=1 Tax=Chromobacterium haemolyticum TaxID=394935 RepID=UPI00244AE97F|nr:hypothetical protein [Chromobacterium haemolyticum]MDH0340650.1 hypothetical protein [Chromobacterium haemolyticum]
MNPLIQLAEEVERAASTDCSPECMSIAITALIAGAKLAAKRHQEESEKWQWLLHDNITAMQAAWIEWKHGEGAEGAMEWIENALDGPDLIPGEDKPNSQNAQAWYDANCSQALKKTAT